MSREQLGASANIIPARFLDAASLPQVFMRPFFPFLFFPLQMYLRIGALSR